MNILDSKEYLEKQLNDVTVNIIEYYENKPNNRYEFSKAGIEKPVATLIAQKLPLTNEFLDDLAVAVNRKFNDLPRTAEVLPKASEEVARVEPELVDNEEKQPSSIEIEFYRAAKAIVAEYEKSYPTT